MEALFRAAVAGSMCQGSSSQQGPGVNAVVLIRHAQPFSLLAFALMVQKWVNQLALSGAQGSGTEVCEGPVRSSLPPTFRVGKAVSGVALMNGGSCTSMSFHVLGASVALSEEAWAGVGVAGWTGHSPYGTHWCLEKW